MGPNREYEGKQGRKMKQQESVFRINQEGYIPGLPIHLALLTDEEAAVLDAEGKKVHTILPGTAAEDAASGDRVRTVVIPPLEAGEYELVSQGEHRTFTVR